MLSVALGARGFAVTDYYIALRQSDSQLRQRRFGRRLFLLYGHNSAAIMFLSAELMLSDFIASAGPLISGQPAITP